MKHDKCQPEEARCPCEETDCCRHTDPTYCCVCHVSGPGIRTKPCLSDTGHSVVADLHLTRARTPAQVAEDTAREAHQKVAWLCGGCGSQRQPPYPGNRCLNCESTHVEFDSALAARAWAAVEEALAVSLPSGRVSNGLYKLRDRLRREWEEASK